MSDIICANCGHTNTRSGYSTICEKCGKSFRQTQSTAVTHRSLPAESKRKFIYIAIGVVILASVACIFGYRYYRVSQLKGKLEEAIGRDGGYIETILKTEKESSNMTYKEFFDLCDKSIEARTNLIVELRGLYPDIQYDAKESLVEFLNNENELVRAKRNFYRKQFDFSSSLKLYEDETLPSSEYLIDYYIERKAQFKSDVLKAISEMLDSADNFQISYERILSLEASFVDKMTDASIRFNSNFKNFQEANNKMILEAKRVAKDIKNALTS